MKQRIVWPKVLHRGEAMGRACCPRPCVMRSSVRNVALWCPLPAG